jgi:hypothetical protein
MNITIVKPANRGNVPGFLIAIVPEELSHGPRFQRRPMLAEAREMANEDLDQIGLAIPKVGQQ